MASCNSMGYEHKPADDKSNPGEHSLEGKRVRCPHCSGPGFKASHAQLKTVLATCFEIGVDE